MKKKMKINKKVRGQCNFSILLQTMTSIYYKGYKSLPLNLGSRLYLEVPSIYWLSLLSKIGLT